MPRPKLHYAALASKAFLRGTAHPSVEAAVAAGARTNDEWSLFLRRFEQRFWIRHNRKARRAVKARHPVQVSDAARPSEEGETAP